jgi:aminopeptidase N
MTAARPLVRLAAALAATAAALHAQTPAPRPTNAERMATDRYSRSHDYDLVHQAISLGSVRWDSLSFRGRVATTLVSLRPGLDSVVLDCGPLLRITRAAAAGGAPLRTAARGDTLVVFLARPAAFRDTVRFTLDYDGRVVNGRGLTFIESEGRAHRPRQLWSQGESSDNHLWFPTYDFPNDKLTWELTATVPDSFTVVSNGTLALDRRNADRTRTTTWRQTTPASSYLVSLVVAPLVKVHDAWRGRPVDYYVYRADSALARPLFRVTPDMIETYSELTGVAYPWAKYAQTTVADFFGGMENVSATTLVDWLPDAAAYRDRPWFQHVLIPHELAHQWFGDLVTTGNWANMWLNEGFAEYMPGAYWFTRRGAYAEDDYFLDEYRQYLQIDAGRRMPLASSGSNVIYPKGALVLRMLERQLGRDRFWASVNRYLVRHAHGTAVTDDFRQAVLDATGENVSGFFDQWLYQAGHPEFRVRARYDSAARALTLDVAQTQVDTGAARTGPGADSAVRYTTPSAFRATVAVRVGVRGAPDVVREVAIDRREQTVVIDGVASAPTMVVFDDGNRVLKTLDFEQPTAWLAAQLAHDDDLWNRDWVIRQLAGKVADPEAVAALATAARSADYFLTRAQAAAALGSYGEAQALPALEAALADTSSAVREAALESLARIGGARAAALGRASLARDPSYAVRAAALGAAAGDSAGRTAMLASAIASASYRDAVANAALGIAARANDAGALPAMEARLGDLPLAAQAVAVLAGRGDAAALAALVRHLDDERPFVRRNVVQAIQRLVPPAISAPALTPVVDRLRFPETAAAVRALLAAAPPR